MSDDQKAQPTNSGLGKPLNPNTDFEEVIADATGLTGITTTNKENVKNVSPASVSSLQNDATNLSSPSPTVVQDKINEGEGHEKLDYGGFEAGNETLFEGAPPHVVGEQAVSGDMPDPSSDDDTLRMSHEVGLRLDEDEENPKPLNIAADVAAAEKSREQS